MKQWTPLTKCLVANKLLATKTHINPTLISNIGLRMQWGVLLKYTLQLFSTLLLSFTNTWTDSFFPSVGRRRRTGQIWHHRLCQRPRKNRWVFHDNGVPVASYQDRNKSLPRCWHWWPCVFLQGDGMNAYMAYKVTTQVSDHWCMLHSDAFSGSETESCKHAH